MLTQDFARKTRERTVETRAALTRLRELTKETIKQLAKINRQHTAERDRLATKLSQLADDVVDKLPEEAAEDDYDRARAIQDQVNDLASDVEEISLAASAIEDFEVLAKDTVDEAFASLRETDMQLAKIERLAAKLAL